jgi:hypothetical protein
MQFSFARDIFVNIWKCSAQNAQRLTQFQGFAFNSESGTSNRVQR